MNPLTGLYGAGTALRNALFDRGLLRARRLERPVISIGNLSVGGSGKTPFVIALGELLRERGITFDVLSRGYRRQTRGVLVVDPDGTPADFGDEPLLMARRLGAPVIVGESRYDAGRLAEQKFSSQLHLLDDGFQHRSLARDVDIVLLAAGDLEDRLLPSGRLREPLSSLRRADAIVLPQDLAGTRLINGLEAFRSGPQGLKPTSLLGPRGTAEAVLFPKPIYETSSGDAPALRDKLTWRVRREVLLGDVPARPVVFCGIARPEQFFAQVRAAGVAPAAEIPFRDHHAYNQNDVARLTAARRDLNAGGFLTTEKDLVNFGPLRSALEPLSVAQLRLTLDRPADLVDTILARITDRKPRS